MSDKREEKLLQIVKNFDKGEDPTYSMKGWNKETLRDSIESGVRNLTGHMEALISETRIDKLTPESLIVRNMGMHTGLEMMATAAMELARRLHPETEDVSEKATDIIKEVMKEKTA